MERHTMFINLKTQQSRDINFPQIDILVEHNFYQNTRKVFWRQNHSKIHMEGQRNYFSSNSSKI